MRRRRRLPNVKYLRGTSLLGTTGEFYTGQSDTNVVTDRYLGTSAGFPAPRTTSNVDSSRYMHCVLVLSLACVSSSLLVLLLHVLHTRAASMVLD